MTRRSSHKKHGDFIHFFQQRKAHISKQKSYELRSTSFGSRQVFRDCPALSNNVNVISRENLTQSHTATTIPDLCKEA